MRSDSQRIKDIGEEAMASIIMTEPAGQLVASICALMGMVGEVAIQIAELRSDMKMTPVSDPSKFN